jgi:hypothetical protein
MIRHIFAARKRGACPGDERPHSRKPVLSVLGTSLTVNFQGNAQPGDGMEAHVDLIRSGPRVVIFDCLIWANGRRIAQASVQCLRNAADRDVVRL